MRSLQRAVRANLVEERIASGHGCDMNVLAMDVAVANNERTVSLA